MKTKFKTFEDLKFKQHPAAGFDEKALLYFKNKFGVSVVTGDSSYSDSSHPYEVAVVKDGRICYETYLTDDVIGYCTEKDVTQIMKQVQELSSGGKGKGKSWNQKRTLSEVFGSIDTIVKARIK